MNTFNNVKNPNMNNSDHFVNTGCARQTVYNTINKIASANAIKEKRGHSQRFVLASPASVIRSQET